MKRVAGKIFFTAISVLYPVLVYCGIRYWGLSPRRMSLMLLALGFYHFLNFTRSKSKADRGRTGALVALVLVCALVAFACVFRIYAMATAELCVPNGVPGEQVVEHIAFV